MKGMAVITMTDTAPRVTGGVDTDLDVHVVAALDERAGQLGVESFPANAAGYRQALCWLRSFGVLERVGVEGTGTYGAGLARYLQVRPGRRGLGRSGRPGRRS